MGAEDAARHDELMKELTQKYPSNEVSEFVRYKNVQTALEVTGEDPVSAFAGILLLILKLKLQFDLNAEQPFSAVVTLPRRFDGLNEVVEDDKSDEYKTKVQVSLYRNTESKKGFTLDIKRLDGDFFAVKDFYHSLY